MPQLLELTERGLYCALGDFYIDPWREVPRAIITHAHGDHARPGSGRYATASPGSDVLKLRMGDSAIIDAWQYGQQLRLGAVQVSLHPAGHVLGSAQVRLEHRGEVWVASGDYKLASDPTCAPFEPIECDTFVTESTFGLPIYRWRPQEEVLADIHAWWQSNQQRKRTSVLFVYSLGKAQRVLAQLDAGVGPLLGHGAVLRYLPAYEAAGVRFPPIAHATLEHRRRERGRALILAPPSVMGTPWLRSLGAVATAIVSGWMQIRGVRRRKAVDRGFVISDHADWPDLQTAIEATGANNVWVTHGYTAAMTRWLIEQGYNAHALSTEFNGESMDVEPALEDQAASQAPE